VSNPTYTQATIKRTDGTEPSESALTWLDEWEIGTTVFRLPTSKVGPRQHKRVAEYQALLDKWLPGHRIVVETYVPEGVKA
jgi:hypothetical protein